MKPTPPLSIYLHIPFCASLCTYCAFNTYEGLDALIPSFVESLAQEIRIVGQLAPDKHIHTVFFGGGTPSLLNPRQIELVLKAIEDVFIIDWDTAEITLEANPNDLHLDYLRSLRQLGLNRLSIGMQSAIPRELVLFNRRHDVQMVIDAVAFARQAQFDNISLDVIYGNPYQSLSDWRITLELAVQLAPNHISLYGLELKGNTPLQLDVNTGRIPAPDDDLAADMYDMATELLDKAGYKQYEISNWSREGWQSQHNLQYWRNLPYLGFGPGAHGFAGGVRYSTVLRPQRYIDLMSKANADYIFPRSPATAKVTKIDKSTEIGETMMMGLRLIEEGIRRDLFRERFGVDVVAYYDAIVHKFINNGLLYVDEDHIRLTPRARLISNIVIREFI